MALLLEYYVASTPPLSNTALECLVRLASVRRSLFTSDAERARFLNRCVALPVLAPCLIWHPLL